MGKMVLWRESDNRALAGEEGGIESVGAKV